MKLVILAAGGGSRMRPLSDSRPKPMLSVAGRPIVEHLLRNAVAAGIDHVILVVPKEASAFKDHFGNGKGFGCTIDYAIQSAPRGTAHAVAAAADRVDEACMVVNGDATFSVEDLAAIRKAKGLALGGRNVKDARPYGALQLDGGLVVGINEKPKDAAAGTVNAGLYRVDDGVLDACRRVTDSARGEKELTDALMLRVKEGARLKLIETPSWREAGYAWDLLGLQSSLMADLGTRIDGKIDDNVVVEGALVVEKGARVHGGTRIEGPVIIGANARVGPNSYVRGATSIGADCRIGAGVELKNSIVMSSSNIPHLSYVGDSVIGSRVNLGAGTQVANLKITDTPVRVRWQGKRWLDTGLRKLGVIMGDDVHTGVNASINPGTVVGAAAMIGAGVTARGWIEPGARVL